MGAVASSLFNSSIQSMAFLPPPQPTYRRNEVEILRTIAGDEIACKIYTYQNLAMRKERRMIILSHGNAVDIGENGKYAQWVADACCSNVIAYDYVNYGHSSSGLTTELNMQQAAETVYEYVTGQLQIQHGCVFVMGKSLGSAPTLHLASTPGPRSGISGVILMSPLASGYRVLSGNANSCSMLAHSLDQAFCPNIDKIKHVKSHVLIVHGLNDEVVHVDNAKMLHKNIDAEYIYPMELLSGGHNDVEMKNIDHLENVFQKFLRACDTSSVAQDSVTEKYCIE